MACRATGFTMLASNSVQEAKDMALIAKAASLESRIPADDRAAHPRPLAKRPCLRKTVVRFLFDQLESQRDANAVHQHDTLIDQILIGDLRFSEPMKGAQRANEFDGFGGPRSGGLQRIHD
jgi:hypothetical protein